LKVSNRVIIPIHNSYKEKLICKTLHCFQGDFEVKNKTSVFNPFLEFGYNCRSRNYKKFGLDLIFGVQFLRLENIKHGEYTNYSQLPASGYFKGEIVNKYTEYSTYLNLQPSYLILSEQEFNVRLKINIRLDYPIQELYYQKSNGIDNNTNLVNTSTEFTKSHSSDLSFYLISFSSLEGNYKLNEKFSIVIDLSVPIFFINDLFDDEANDPFNNYYNNPRYILNYRSSINQINYITTNLGLKFKIK
jgi:hypothetical protein